MAEPPYSHLQEFKPGQEQQPGYPQQAPMDQGQPPHQTYQLQYPVNQQMNTLGTTSTNLVSTTVSIKRDLQIQPADYLVLSIFVMTCCCLQLGLIACIRSLQVGWRYSAGDMDGALQASKSAKEFGIAGLIIGLVLLGINLLVCIISVVISV